jgi:hypothetical protein
MTRFAMGVTVLMLIGCSGGSGVPYTDHSRDPEAFAASIKEMVFLAVEDARRSAEPEEAIEGVVEAFDGRLGTLPVGDYRPIYEQLLSVASELHQEAERIDGRPSDLDQRLDELVGIAKQLPGDEPAERPRDSG